MQTLKLLLDVALVPLAAIALGLLLGYAPARLLLPAALRPHRWLLTPGIGLAVLVVTTSFVNTWWLSVGAFVPWLVLLAAVADVAVRVRLGRERTPSDRRLLATGALLGLVAFALGVAPLLRYGFLTAIGENWDPPEIYLPLAEFLQRYRIDGPIPWQDNPQVHALLDQPVTKGGSGLGFSYLHATLDTLLARPAHTTFAALVATLLGLALPGLTVLARWLGLGRAASSWALLLLAFHPLVLWMGYFSFGPQAMVFALFPTALALLLAALDDGTLSGAAVAGLVTAALLLSYYMPVIPLLLPPLALAVAFRLARPGQRRAVLRSTATFALFALGLSLLGHVLYLEVVRKVDLSLPSLSVGPGISVFVRPGVLFGVEVYPQPHFGVLERAVSHLALAPTTNVWIDGAFTAALLALGLLAAWRRRGDTAALVLGGAMLPLYLYFVRPYPYGYLKALSLVAFAAVLGAASGLEALVAMTRPDSRARLATRTLAGVFAAVVAAIVVGNGVAAEERYARPGRRHGPLDLRLTETIEMRRVLPHGATVYLSPRLRGPTIGFLSYVLVDQRVRGTSYSGYSRYFHEPEGDELTDYAIFLARERPPAPYQSYREVWRNVVYRLYARPPALLAVQVEPGTQVLLPGEDVACVVAAPAPASELAAGPSARHDLRVRARVLGRQPTDIEARLGDVATTSQLRAGYFGEMVLGNARLPGSLSLRVTGPGAIALQAIEVWRLEAAEGTSATPSSRREDTSPGFLRSRAWLDPWQLGHVDLETTGRDDGDHAAGARSAELVIVADDPGSTAEITPLPLTLVPGQRLRIEITFATGRMTVDGREHGGSAGTWPDGGYAAWLRLGSDGRAETLGPLFALTLVEGDVRAYRAIDGEHSLGTAAR